MATRVDVPQLGLTMETGTILQWLKAEGDKVEKGQPVVVIQTDKVEYEVEAPVAGTLLKIAAKEGTELPVGLRYRIQIWRMHGSRASNPPCDQGRVCPKE